MITTTVNTFLQGLLSLVFTQCFDSTCIEQVPYRLDSCMTVSFPIILKKIVIMPGFYL